MAKINFVPLHLKSQNPRHLQLIFDFVAVLAILAILTILTIWAILNKCPFTCCQGQFFFEIQQSFEFFYGKRVNAFLQIFQRFFSLKKKKKYNILTFFIINKKEKTFSPVLCTYFGKVYIRKSLQVLEILDKFKQFRKALINTSRHAKFGKVYITKSLQQSVLQVLEILDKF